MTLSIDPACPGINGREEMQGPIAPLLMFNALWASRLRGFRGVESWPGRQGGLFIQAAKHFIGLKGARVEGAESRHLRIASCIAGILQRQPQMMPPGFELVMGENPADG